MNAASLSTSPRLQRVFSLLRKGKEFSTRDICRLANVYAVNSCIDELREPKNGGHNIPCERRGKHFYYRMIKEKA